MQRERDARTRAEQEKVLKTTLGAIEYFEEVYYKEVVTEDELKELRTWTRDNFGSTVGPDKKSTWEGKIDKKIDELSKEKPNYYVDAAKRGIVKLYNEGTKDLAADDELEAAAQSEREKYETEGAFEQWVEDFKTKMAAIPCPMR